MNFFNYLRRSMMISGWWRRMKFFFRRCSATTSASTAKAWIVCDLVCHGNFCRPPHLDVESLQMPASPRQVKMTTKFGWAVFTECPVILKLRNRSELNWVKQQYFSFSVSTSEFRLTQVVRRSENSQLGVSLVPRKESSKSLVDF